MTAKSNVISFPSPSTPKPAANERYSKRADGRYQVAYRYIDSSGTSQRKYFYGATQKDAKKKLDEFKRAQENGQDVVSMSISTAAWVERWLALRAVKDADRATAQTYDTYKRESDRLVKSVGKKLLREVRTSDIQAIVDTRSGMSKKSIRSTYASIRQIFEVARCDRIITYNPCDGVKLPDGTAGSHRALTSDERALITSTWEGHRFGLASMLMLYAGLRRGEAAALKWDHIDLAAGVIRITEAVAYDVNTAVTKSTKTLSGVRDVPIVKPLRDALDIYTGERTGFVWISAEKKQLSQSACERGWESYVYYLSKALNGCTYRWAKDKDKWVKMDIRMHDLRHTFCTMLYDAGVDVKRAQVLMGHKDLAVTMGIYTHLSDERKQRSDDALHAYFSNGCQSGCQTVETDDFSP